MGNSTSNPQEGSHLNDTDSLNWNNINTQDMSSVQDKTGINYNTSKNFNNYLGGFQIPTVSASSEDFNVSRILNKETENFYKGHLEVSENNMNETSPFISSEMYKFVMQGGADDGSSSTSTSSSSSNNKKNKKDKKDSSSSNKSNSDSNSDKTESHGGYISSSAHESSKNEQDSDSSSARVVSSSLNTSDINLISLKQ